MPGLRVDLHIVPIRCTYERPGVLKFSLNNSLRNNSSRNNSVLSGGPPVYKSESMANHGSYQDEIYFAGLSGTLPKLPVDFATLEKLAHAAMSPSLVSYVAGGCGDEHTQRANVSAFEHWGLIPRMLAGRPVRDLSIKLFGMELATPIFMS